MKLLKVDTIDQVRDKLVQYFGTGASETGSAPAAGLVETLPLMQAVGRFLAEDICSEEAVPGFDRSIVDGYAVHAQDTFGVSDSIPVFLTITGQVEMGTDAAATIHRSEAMYVPTGGALPAGADAVVMVEYAEKLDEKTVAIYKAAAPGSGVMARGEDFLEGAVVYKKGHRIKAGDVGMLAALGMGMVTVFPKPEVSIISTGDELISVFETPGPGQIRDVNSHSLAAQVEASGGKVCGVYLVRDNREAISSALQQALTKSNIVLLSGGSSAGEKDMTAEIIDSMGQPGVFTHGIAMKPGKPTIVGALKNPRCCCNSKPQLVVGLPGHPMAAIIAYQAVVDYYIKKYCFGTTQAFLTVTAELTENVPAGEGRETFVMVRLHKKAQADGEGSLLTAEPIHAKSGSISQLCYADGYLRLSHLSEGMAQGRQVEIVLLP